MTGILVIGVDDVAERIRGVTDEPVATVAWPDGLGVDGVLALIDDDDPVAVVLDGTIDHERALAVASAVELARPHVGMVVALEKIEGFWEQILRSGVRDVITADTTDGELQESVDRVLEVGRRRRGGATPSGSHRLIVVVSPKGGAGKTTVAVNLAVGLATRAPRQVALVDGDLQFGDVANALRLLPDSSVLDAVSGGLYDVSEVKVHLTTHRSGLFALCAPEEPGDDDEIDTGRFTRAIGLLSGAFPFVIVDTDPGLSERTLGVIEQATDVVFVAATDVPAVRGLHKSLRALDRVGLTEQTRHFVLNRSDARVGLELEDISATVGLDPDVCIPSSRIVPVAMNQGSPVIELDDGSVASALWQLVDRFLPTRVEAAAAPARRGFLRRG